MQRQTLVEVEKLELVEVKNIDKHGENPAVDATVVMAKDGHFMLMALLNEQCKS